MTGNQSLGMEHISVLLPICRNRLIFMQAFISLYHFLISTKKRKESRDRESHIKMNKSLGYGE